MQTHVLAPADQAKQQQSKTVQQHTQLVSEQQRALVDNRPEMAEGLQLRQLMDNSRQAVEGRALQAMMNNSAQAREAQAFQLMLNASARANSPLQRVEKEEPLQAKVANENTAQLATAAEAPKPNNTGLPDNLKSGIESLSGMSMDHVKVHYNSSQPAQLNAHAYAQGSEIHVAPGQEPHLPHEAWHVVQQAQGRVKPTMQMKTGVAVNDDAGLGREADMMGDRALQGIVQRAVSYDDDMANAVENYTTEMRETDTEEAVATIYDHDLDGTTYGVYKTDVPSECQMVANKISGAPEKIILPAMLEIETRGAPMSHGVTAEQQYKALARHELMHLRQALHNQGGSARLGTNAEAFSAANLVATLDELNGLVPVEKVVEDAQEGIAQQRRRKSNALRTYVDSRIQYIVTSAIQENQRGIDEGATEEVIASRMNYEAPTVIAELRDIVGHAITGNTIEVDGWDVFHDKLKEHHAALLQAGA